MLLETYKNISCDDSVLPENLAKGCADSFGAKNFGDRRRRSEAIRSI